MTHKNYLDNFFHIVSRFILFIPIIILVLAFFLKYYQLPKTRSSQEVNSIPSSPTTIPSPTSVYPAFDLQGPSVCQTIINNASISAAIKNKMIFASVWQNQIKKNFLVSGDCMYQWNTGASYGQKTCGVGQYLSILQTFNTFGTLNLTSLLSYVPQLGFNKTIPVNADQISQFLSSCKKQETNDSLFSIPRGVYFK